TCIKYYELDPSHYVSAPSLSWDAMLKKTGVKIKLFTDISMYDFIEKAKRVVYLRLEASREYLLKYPAMQKKYLEKILKTKANVSRRYFLNIKSHFPLKTHDYLRDLSPAVKNVAVEKDWLSPYNEELVNNLDGGHFSKTEKLVPHLSLRKDYVIHYLEFQYYVKLGMVVDKVSEILFFDQTN
ncbi:hypothetical protein RclHR1_42870001, partial [Rhizophagus clarus]